MKKISHIVSCVIAICLFFALYVFLFDLACIGRISKFNHIWTGVCPFDIDGAYLNCMASYDIVSIVIILLSQMGIVDTDLWFFAVQFIGYNILGTGVVCL